MGVQLAPDIFEFPDAAGFDPPTAERFNLGGGGVEVVHDQGPGAAGSCRTWGPVPARPAARTRTGQSLRIRGVDDEVSTEARMAVLSWS